MTLSTPLSGINHPFKGILLIVAATFLFSSHDALSKYLAGFYPIVMVVWARYLVHTLLMAGIFLPQSGLRGAAQQTARHAGGAGVVPVGHQPVFYLRPWITSRWRKPRR